MGWPNPTREGFVSTQPNSYPENPTHAHPYFDAIFVFDAVNYEFVLSDVRLDVAVRSAGVVALPDDYVRCSWTNDLDDKIIALAFYHSIPPFSCYIYHVDFYATRDGNTLLC